MLLSIGVSPFIDAGRKHGKNEVVKSFHDRQTFIRFPAAVIPADWQSLSLFVDCFLPFEIALVARQRLSFCGLILSDPDSHLRRSIASDRDKLGINLLPLIADSLLPPRERKVLAKGKHKRATGYSTLFVLRGWLPFESGSSRWNYIFGMGTNPSVFATLPVNSPRKEKLGENLPLERHVPFSQRRAFAF